MTFNADAPIYNMRHTHVIYIHIFSLVLFSTLSDLKVDIMYYDKQFRDIFKIIMYNSLIHNITRIVLQSMTDKTVSSYEFET